MPQTSPCPSLRGRTIVERVRVALALVAIMAAAVGCSESPGTVPDGDPADVKIDIQKTDAKPSDSTDAIDPGDVSDAVDAAADSTAVLPGEFSAPCKDSGDCNTGLCVQAYSGKICSHSCESSPCEPGYSCQQVSASGGDQLYACVPKFKHLCEPCNQNTDCNDAGESNNVCIGFGEVGAFCGATCDPTESDCPLGYTCSTVVNPATGAKVSQCKHQGICECSPKATQLGLSTNCSNTSQWGKCSGVRQCGAEGLSECSASIPDEEKCNGIDDDCNGQTDDLSAFNQKCAIPLNEFNVGGKNCVGKLVSCTNGVPKCDGPAAAPEACNGIDDNCDGQTDEGLCQDGDPCTKDTCNTDGSCQHVQLGGLVCDDGSLCTQTDKCVAGKCLGGNALNCDDNDPCTTDSCDPFTGCLHVVASDAECKDDGNLCTADVCKNGTCQHIVQDNLKCLDDGNQCTSDICQGGNCKHVNSSAPCDDGNACTDGDVCSGGNCLKGKLKTCDDGNPCTVDKCDPNLAGGCSHEPNDFAACTSSSATCPIGECAGGACYPKANATCETTVDTSFCSSSPIAGVCTSSGKCVVTKAPTQYTCPGCNGICLNCAPFGQFCIPLTSTP